MERIIKDNMWKQLERIFGGNIWSCKSWYKIGEVGVKTREKVAVISEIQRLLNDERCEIWIWNNQ